MLLIEKSGETRAKYDRWHKNAELKGYPFVVNENSPFRPVHRALPMLNLALISSAGGYIDGTPSFQIEDPDGDYSLKEIPTEVEAIDTRYAAIGYETAAVHKDRNSLVPIDRLTEYQENGVIGALNQVWWSVGSYLPNANRVADELTPNVVGRLQRYGVQAALLIPASELCHQSLGIIARGLEMSGIPTIMLSVRRNITDMVRPPRVAYYDGNLGTTAGEPDWKQYQLRILDETLRWIETFDQPGSRKLAVEIETVTEMSRGER